MTRTRKTPAPSTSAVNRSEHEPFRSDLVAMFATFASDVEHVLDATDWAEDEIEQAMGRHPDHADALCHAFSLIRPRDAGPGMATEFVYRSHARELLDRIATGADTRLATAAEMCLVCVHISLKVPLHAAAAGLFFRQWLRAFPDRPITPTQAADQAHYEQLHGTQIDAYETTLRRKMTSPHRLLAGIDCEGRHLGQSVACRYAA